MNEILEALKTKFAGFNEKQLTVKAKSMHKKGQTAEDVEKLTAEDVIEAYADYRATEAAKTAREKAEADKKADKESKEDKGDKKSEPDPDVPAWAKVLIDSNNELKGKLTALEADKVNNSRSARLNTLISQLPETYRKGYTRIPVSGKTDEEFETYMEELTTEVTDLVAELKADGVQFTTRSTGNTKSVKEATDAEVDAVLEHIGLSPKKD